MGIQKRENNFDNHPYRENGRETGNYYSIFLHKDDQEINAVRGEEKVMQITLITIVTVVTIDSITTLFRVI